METFVRDVRWGLRLLVNQPGFFLVAVLSPASCCARRGPQTRAGRSRLAWCRARPPGSTLLTESLILSMVGGAAGVLIAWLTLDVLVANIPLNLPSNSPVDLNPRVLAFSILLSIASGLLFGHAARGLNWLNSWRALMSRLRASGRPLQRAPYRTSL